MVEWPLSNRASASLLGYTLEVTHKRTRLLQYFPISFDEKILYTFNQHTSEIHHQWPFHFFFFDREMVFFDAHPCHTVACMIMFVMNRFHIFITTVTWKVNLLNKRIWIFLLWIFTLILTIQCRINRFWLFNAELPGYIIENGQPQCLIT